jgi:hypothetical protein
MYFQVHLKKPWPVLSECAVVADLNTIL